MEFVPGDPQELADICKQYGVKRLVFKLLEKDKIYTQNRYPSSFNVTDKWLMDYFDVLRANGIEVEGWGYHYPDRVAAQGVAIEERRQKLGITTYHVNIEKEYKKLWGMSRAIKATLGELKVNGFEVLICSYRFPSYHKYVPWDAAMNHEATDGASPQVYWMGQHNPTYQLYRTFEEYKQWGKPLYPIAPTWGQNVKVGDKTVYWEPTVLDLRVFREWCEANGVERVYYWRLGWLLNKKRFDWLEAATGIYDPRPAPPIPPPDPEWEEIDLIKRVRVTATPHLNIRSKRNGADLGNLMPKSVVPITETDGDWGLVEGWIHLGYTIDD